HPELEEITEAHGRRALHAEMTGRPAVRQPEPPGIGVRGAHDLVLEAREEPCHLEAQLSFAREARAKLVVDGVLGGELRALLLCPDGRREPRRGVADMKAAEDMRGGRAIDDPDPRERRDRVAVVLEGNVLWLAVYIVAQRLPLAMDVLETDPRRDQQVA